MKLRGNTFGLRRQAKRDDAFASPVIDAANAPSPLRSAGALRAFTLVELVVVMTLLVTVIALASPSLAGFFRGRAVDAEARRFMSLTRLGQSRAASEGVPVILWVDTAQHTYGLEVDSSFVDQDTKAVEYTLDGNVTAEIGATDAVRDRHPAKRPLQSGAFPPALFYRPIELRRGSPRRLRR